MATSIVDFLIKLRADGTNAISVARRLEGQLTKVERRAKMVGGALRSAFSLSNFNAALMTIPGMQFLMNPYVMAGAAVGAVMKVGLAAEKTAVSFTTLLGSQEASKKMLEDIGKMDAKKVYGVDTLQETTKNMLNFGVESDKVLTYMKQLGDIAGGDKQKLASLGVVFGQVTAAGKLSGQDLLQFINAGFNPLKELEALTGKTYAELQDQMSKGGISADMVAQAMQRATSEGGLFFGMTDAMSQTTGAKLQDMWSKFTQGALAVWQQIQPIVSEVIGIISSILQPIMTVVSYVIKAIALVITWILKWKTEIGLLAVVLGTFWVSIRAKTIALTIWATVVKGVTAVTRVWTTVQRYLNLVLKANPIGFVISLVAALAAAVIYCWHNFDGFRNFCLAAWDVMKGLGQAIANYVTNRLKELAGAVGDVGQALKLLFEGKFKEAWSAAKSAGSKLIGTGSVSGFISDVKGSFIHGKAVYGALQSQPKPDTPNFLENITDIPTVELPTIPEGEGGTAGGGGTAGVGTGGGGKNGGSNNTASAIATGGQRSTSITMNIAKFFDNINVYMADKADTAELEKAVVGALNRALAISTSMNS